MQSGTAAAASDAVQIAKEDMAKVVTKYALRGGVKAQQTGNITLSNQLNHPITYILQAPKTVAVQRAKDLANQLNSNLSTLINITAANITEMITAITAYHIIKDTPIINVQHRAATGTNPLPTAYIAAFTAIDNIFDLISSYFTDTNQPMVDEFAMAKHIIHTGIHHTGITGMVTKGGYPVKDATVSIIGTTKVGKTDVEGNYTISKLQTGNNTIITTSADGTQSKTAYITKGNFKTIDFEL